MFIDCAYISDFFSFSFHQLYIIFRKDGDRDIGPTVPAHAPKGEIPADVNVPVTPTITVTEASNADESASAFRLPLVFSFFDYAFQCCSVPEASIQDQLLVVYVHFLEPAMSFFSFIETVTSAQSGLYATIVNKVWRLRVP